MRRLSTSSADRALLNSMLPRAQEITRELKRATVSTTDPLEQTRRLSGLLQQCADLVFMMSSAAEDRRRDDFKEAPLSYWCLDVGQLKALGLLRPIATSGTMWLPPNQGPWAVTIASDEGQTELSIKSEPPQSIKISETQPGFGGERQWFLCPGISGSNCGRRTLKLYSSEGYANFACRSCHKKTHDSSWRSTGQRWISRPLIQSGSNLTSLPEW